MAATITAYKDCQNCQYFVQIDKYYMTCIARNKKYMYGQSVPCNNKVKVTKSKKKEKTNNEEE